MVDLGTTRRGDPVLMNKYVFGCDVPIPIGHTQGNPYGSTSDGTVKGYCEEMQNGHAEGRQHEASDAKDDVSDFVLFDVMGDALK